MSKAEEEQQARLERARAIGLFRYMLIRDAADPALSSRQRGAMVRQIAAREHCGPSGEPVRLTRWTLDKWIRDWRRDGFDALVPAPRQAQPRTPPEVIELAAALKKENPARTAAQVRRILKAQAGWAPDERTIQRMFIREGLTALAAPDAAPEAFGRFEAGRPNEIWTGDALHAIRVAGRKTYLFAFIDDRSRAVMAARFGFAEDTIRLAAALRPALASRGIPENVYVDNGSAFVDAWLLRACARLGIKLVHSTPGRPQGRGKIERFFRTVRTQFLAEFTEERAAQVPGLAELNRLFAAWTETVYHVREHSETGVRHEAHCYIARKAGRDERRYLWIQCLTGARKSEWENSMAENRRPGPDVRGGASGDPHDKAKVGLPEAQSPAGGIGHPPERHLKPVPASAAGWHGARRNPLRPGAMPSQGIQGDGKAA